MLFLFKKALGSILIPPGPFILAFLAAGFSLFKTRKKLAYILVAFGLGLYLLSTAVISGAIDAPLGRGARIPVADFQGDVIVVLGSGISDSYDPGGNNPMAGVSTGSLQRIMCAYSLWSQKKLPIIYSGASVLGGKVSEAFAAKRVFILLGVPSDMVIEEGRAMDTRENVWYSKEIMKKTGFNKAFVVTSAFHATRADLLFDRAGVVHSIHVCGAVDGESHWSFLKIIPDAENLSQSARAIKEYIGLAFYYFAARS